MPQTTWFNKDKKANKMKDLKKMKIIKEEIRKRKNNGGQEKMQTIYGFSEKDKEEKSVIGLAEITQQHTETVNTY